MKILEMPEPQMPEPHPEAAVTEALRSQIQSGHYKAGDRLPTERRLAESLRVDRRVVRQAISRLAGSGLVVRRPHCRPVVAHPSVAHPGVTAAKARETASGGRQSVSAASSFVALLMWNGFGQRGGTISSQQRVFWGMTEALSQAGRHAVFMDLGQLGTEPENAAREAAQLRYVQEQGFGGAIFYPHAYRSNRALIEEICREIPVVAIDRRCASPDTDFVGVDNHQAIHALVRHLIGLGHRRIAYVTKSEQILPVQDRIQGYVDAMREADLDDLVLSMPTRDWHPAWTVVDTIFCLPAGERPTAAVAFNDYAASELTEHLQALGLSVPQDVAVTGFDGILPTLPNGVGLTTAAHPYEEIGKKAVELLLRRLTDPAAPPLSASLPAPLVIRESSGGPHRE